jgi:hypothetical protein
MRLPLPGKFLPVAHNVQPGEAFIGFPFYFLVLIAYFCLVFK